MPIIWNLSGLLKDRGIKRASELRRIVHERTGYRLSNQAVCDLLNSQPKMVRLETSQALCDALYCRLSDFFEVKPSAAVRARVKPASKVGKSHNNRTGPSDQCAGGNDQSAQERSGEESSVDFASFFPDARNFKS